MTAVHVPQAFYIGDTWELQVTCHDADGEVLDLGPATEIEWKLDDLDGDNIATLKLTTGGIFRRTSDGADGVCIVTLPATTSANVEPGFYRDQLRVWFGEYVSTQVVGRIEALEAM